MVRSGYVGRHEGPPDPPGPVPTAPRPVTRGAAPPVLPGEDPRTIAARRPGPDAPVMSLAHPANGSPRGVTRPLIGASVVALLVALLAVMPASAAPGPLLALLSPPASPRGGPPAPQLTLSVPSRDSWSLPPQYVRVTVGGTTRLLQAADGGESWK